MNLKWKEWIVSSEYTFITTKTMELKEYSRKYYEYIEEKILPYEDTKVQLQYYNGEIGYDEDYVKEHLKNNNIKLI